MKSKKRVRALPQPEECGVWLDASQLKKRPHQTVISCTSSRFNPLRRRQSTDSVLVDCTQTKSPQLCTKQTSMYSFFSPTDNRDKQSCITNIHTLTQDVPLVCEKRQEAPNEMKPSAIGPSTCLTQTYREHAENLENFSSYKIQSDTENKSSGQTKTDWSCVLDKPGHGAGNFPNASRAQKKSLKPTNYCATSLSSKSQNNLSDSLLSTCPQEDYKAESLFLPSQSESQLFTQDTQGNQVICHRFPSERPANTFSSIPLLDKTNVTWDTRSPMKGTLQTVCDEETLNNMFTQDSEGNMVIKH
ncbi:aurora kinase A- and ninein-interacting protein isoform X1 [Ranitomeya imitator]|uniref:aurora kinase A- and ninein-interacting protein isoform X1 n=1 Tax=Ranitomeya imitator TaxID=111125 RepID=UPI0037E9C3B3